MNNILKISKHNVVTECKRDHHGEICHLIVSSSNGLKYEVRNQIKSKSRTNLCVTFNNIVVFSGQINQSKYRASSFSECNQHILFHSDETEVLAFLEKFKDKISSLYVTEMPYGKAYESYIWIDRKIYFFYHDNDLNQNMYKIVSKHASKNTLGKWVLKHTEGRSVVFSSNLKGTVSACKIATNHPNSPNFIATHDNEKNIAVFRIGKETKIKESVTEKQYKNVLNDEVAKWAINNPSNYFNKLINEYGFTEGMTYKQVNSLIKMVEI